MIALHTAMRCSEIVNLELQDIDYEKKQIHVRNTKNNHNRFIPMNDELSSIFRKQPLADSKIFPITSLMQLELRFDEPASGLNS